MNKNINSLLVKNNRAIVCPVCSNDSTKFKYKLWSKSSLNIKEDAGKLYKCQMCNFIFKDLHSINLNLEEYYTNLTEDYYDSLNENRRKKEHTMMIRLIKQSIDTGKILDIGCGTGGFLESLDSNKWEKWGVEPALFTKPILMSKGIEAINTSFLTAKLPLEYFDVVTIFDVIEHIDDPRAYLKKAKSLLKRNGVILIATPNVASTMAKFSGRYWRHFTPIGHITFYSPFILKKVLLEEGYNNFHVKKYDYGHSFFNATTTLIRGVFKFLLKSIIISFSKFISWSIGYNLQSRFKPSYFDLINVLPWYYDFFCVKAKR